MTRGASNSKEDIKPATQGVRRGRPSSKFPQQPGIPKINRCLFRDCPKSFHRKSDLKRHENMHNNVRPYKCLHEGCGKAFVQTSALTVHKRVHTGEKPHKCQVCERAFSDSSSLSRHRKSHKTTRCPVDACDQEFQLKNALQEHLNRVHSKDERSCSIRSERSERTPKQRRRKSEKRPVIAKAANAEHQEGVIKVERERSSTPLPLQLASHGSLSAADEAHHSTPPAPAPSSRVLQPDGMRRYLPRAYSARAQRPHLPLTIPTMESVYDLGPMSAPVFHDNTYAGHTTLQCQASLVSQAYAQAYSSNPSGASSPMGQQVPPPDYQSSLPCYLPPRPVYCGRSHANVQGLGLVHVPFQTTDFPTTTMYPPALKGESEIYTGPDRQRQTDQNVFQSIESHYQEPQDVGVVSVVQQYQLPDTSFDLTEEDKMMDAFGESFPSQNLL